MLTNYQLNFQTTNEFNYWKNKIMSLAWNPGHVGILGSYNEETDAKAKEDIAGNSICYIRP